MLVFIEVAVPSRAVMYMCLEVSILTLYAIFRLEVGIVPTVWYSLFFILLLSFRDRSKHCLTNDVLFEILYR